MVVGIELDATHRIPPCASVCSPEVATVPD
jgi:hypothetical protein